MVHAPESAKNFNKGDYVGNTRTGKAGTVVGKWGGYSCCSDYEYNWYYIVEWDNPDPDDWPVDLVNEDNLVKANRKVKIAAKREEKTDGTI